MPAPRKRAQVLASNNAEQFDSTIMANLVYEQVQGQHSKHSDLLRLLKLVEDCYDLADERYGDTCERVGVAVFDAAETMNGEVDAAVDEQIATACAAVLQDAPDWTDAWDEDQIDHATTEAREWLDVDGAGAVDVEPLPRFGGGVVNLVLVPGVRPVRRVLEDGRAGRRDLLVDCGVDLSVHRLGGVEDSHPDALTGVAVPLVGQVVTVLDQLEESE